MKSLSSLLITIMLVGLIACTNSESKQSALSISSPSGKLSMNFILDNNQAAYQLHFEDMLVLDTSHLGLELIGDSDLADGFSITTSSTRAFDHQWEMPWGEQRMVRDHFNELRVDLQENEEPKRKMSFLFRLYNDGLAFRYIVPEQDSIEDLKIAEENTEFNLTGNHDCWWIPGDWDIYEHLYNNTSFVDIDALKYRNHENLAQTYIPNNAVNTPVSMKTKEGLHLCFHEANLTDYSGMTLGVDPEALKLKSILVGGREKYKALVTLPFQSPWRMILVTEKATELVDSRTILNLNEPNKLGDVSWFKPTKYMGIWWEMHLGISTWDMGLTQDMSTWVSDKATSVKHGATTENAKRYIDFASANNIGALLIEGWNTGWEHWIGFEDREGVFDFVTPYPDYDLEEVVRYGKEKGVDLIMHHETSAAPRTYEEQLDTAYTLMNKLGINAVKTGYVGKIIPKGEYHHGQWMVRHYRKVLETAARYNVAINAHEPIKATGIRRTLPNAISREGLRGQEFNAWATDGGNPPNHLPTVAFTRMISGPIDYTPGIFQIKLDEFKKGQQVNTTLAQQLAAYVVIYSPVQMAADLPEHYEGQAAFQFISDVGVDWEESLVLDGEVGAFITIARKERGSESWFLGSLCNEKAREIKVKFDFLDAGVEYNAIIYKDGKDAHWNDNPTSIEIVEVVIKKDEEFAFKLAPGGGVAVSLIPSS
jgi:hypothetical protein